LKLERKPFLPSFALFFARSFLFRSSEEEEEERSEQRKERAEIWDDKDGMKMKMADVPLSLEPTSSPRDGNLPSLHN